MFDTIEYPFLVLLLIGLLAAVTWYMHRSNSSVAKNKVLRWLLIWPILLGKDRAITQGASRGKFLLLLLIALLIVAAFAIVITPPKGG